METKLNIVSLNGANYDIWKKFADQFQKAWANKLTLRRRLFSLKLKEGDPV